MVQEPMCDCKEMSFEEKMDDLRTLIKSVAAYVNSAKEEKQKSELTKGENFGEIMANMTLAYRHLEDASMRIGKVKQHINGGVSIYDKNVVGSPE